MKYATTECIDSNVQHIHKIKIKNSFLLMTLMSFIIYDYFIIFKRKKVQEFIHIQQKKY